MRAAPEREPFPWEPVPAPPGLSVTDTGGGIVPHTLVDLLLRLRADYGDVPILITESGADVRAAPHDARRVAFIHDHLAALHAALEVGVDVRGYCHWSFLDNFEWASGYAPRFGLAHVDYETQMRTLKDSARYYARVARENAVVPA